MRGGGGHSGVDRRRSVLPPAWDQWFVGGLGGVRGTGWCVQVTGLRSEWGAAERQLVVVEPWADRCGRSPVGARARCGTGQAMVRWVGGCGPGPWPCVPCLGHLCCH